MILDDIRARYPAIGVAVYAIDPGQPVTIETYAPDGQVFSFVGDTVDAALAKAFPEMIEDAAPADVVPVPRELLETLRGYVIRSNNNWRQQDFDAVNVFLGGPAEPEAPAPAANVFD